jgi:hypothetical protein
LSCKVLFGLSQHTQCEHAISAPLKHCCVVYMDGIIVIILCLMGWELQCMEEAGAFFQVLLEVAKVETMVLLRDVIPREVDEEAKQTAKPAEQPGMLRVLCLCCPCAAGLGLPCAWHLSRQCFLCHTVCPVPPPCLVPQCVVCTTCMQLSGKG